MPKGSLKNKTVKGVGWSAVDSVAQYAVSFVVSIVLARLLTPEDYGLIGILTIFTMISATIINGGFLNALIRKKEPTEDDYCTVFILNLAVSLLLYLVLFLCSPLIAEFFGREELVSLTRVIAIAIISGALALVQRAKLTKRIDFKTQTKITLIASITSGVIGIVMALLGFGVWSLVAQHLSHSILVTLFLWIFNKWMPKLRFSVSSFKELFGYSWKILVSKLLDTVWKELYQVVVGKFYSPAILGQYTRGKQFAHLFSTTLTNVVQRVTFPVMSEIQDNKERLISGYREIIKTTMFITAISMFSLGAVAEPLLYCLIGPKWHTAATYLPFICVSMSLYPLHAINLNMLQVQGRSDIFLILEIIKKTIGLVPLFIGAFVNIYWMLVTNIITGVIAFFLNTHYTGKSLGYSSWMQLKDVAPSYFIAFTTALSVYFIKYLPISNWIILPLQIIVGITIFLVICKATRIREYKTVKGIVLSMIKRNKK